MGDHGRFRRSLDDIALAEELSRAIHGRGAFRTFKDAVYRRGVQQDWYRFRDAEVAEIAAEWLDVNGIAYARDLDEA